MAGNGSGYVDSGHQDWEAVRAAVRGQGPGVHTPDEIVVVTLGRTNYDSALELQECLRNERIATVIPDVLLLLEHPPVYTLGRGASAVHLGAAAQGRVPVRRVSRGGQVTFHGPGQLVGYPVIDLSQRCADVRGYLRRLEDFLICTVARLGLGSGRIPGYTGVWVSGRKLASIGIGLRHWVSAHGFALNVNTDLEYFDPITPCGIPDVRMTSLWAEGIHADMGEVIRHSAQAFVETFGYARVRHVRAIFSGAKDVGAGTGSRAAG